MTATLETGPVHQGRSRLSALWYVRYALTGAAFGVAWYSEHGHPLAAHALRGGVLLAAALAVLLWRWWRWMGRDAVRRWAVLAMTFAGVLLTACVLAPVLASLHARPEITVGAVAAVAIAALGPLVHRCVGGPREYGAPR